MDIMVGLWRRSGCISSVPTTPPTHSSTVPGREFCIEAATENRTQISSSPHWWVAIIRWRHSTPGRIRTCDPPVRSRMLSIPLSYGSISIVSRWLATGWALTLTVKYQRGRVVLIAISHNGRLYDKNQQTASNASQNHRNLLVTRFCKCGRTTWRH